MCKLPGERTKSSVRVTRRAAVGRVEKLARAMVSSGRVEDLTELDLPRFRWKLLEVPHNWDATKNLGHHGTWEVARQRRAALEKEAWRRG
jgi:hypothetical protein